MATKKKTKKQTINYAPSIIGGSLAFLSIIGFFQLGIVGVYLTHLVQYLIGDFYYLFYFITFGFGAFLLFKGKYPNFKGPRAIGIYFLMFCGVTGFSSLASQKEAGIHLIEQFINQNTFGNGPSGGGFIGIFIYAPLSALFGYQGTIIALVFVFIIGLALLISKTYLDATKKWYLSQREIQKSKNAIKNENKLQVKKTKNKNIKIFNDKDFETIKINMVEDNKISENIIAETEEAIIKKGGRSTPVIHDSFKKEPEQLKLEIDSKLKEEPQSEELDIPTKKLHSKKYQLPPITLLQEIPPSSNASNNTRIARDNAIQLIEVLSQFGVKAEVTDIHIGPSVTKYEVKPEIGVRVNKIAALQDDIKMSLAAKDIRIEAPIPGKAAVGVEIPNLESSVVSLREVLKEAPKISEDNRLLVGLGRDISGKAVNAHLNRMPHLLVAGATGSGKSVCINGIITSLLIRCKPDEVRLLLVDPKKVELTMYNGIPHLLAPVVTDPRKAATALQKVVSEMERRYELFAFSGVRNLAGYNEYLKEKNKTEEKDKQQAYLPYIVTIVDELADLMMVASKEVEDSIMRITQMARAAGIHLIVATQRPSTDVITGIIKANIPSRIAFAVSSGIDSRTILDATGAERLLGKGDMLFSPMGQNHPTRVQGAFISDADVQKVVEFVTAQKKDGEDGFEEEFLTLDNPESSNGYQSDNEDPLFQEIRQFVIEQQKASTSLIQRRFSIGYNRAARLIDQLEAEGIIGPNIGSKPREVFVRSYQEEDL